MAKLLFPKAAVPSAALRDLDFQMPTPVDAPPDADDYLHQIKQDGWRVFVGVDDRGALSVRTRNGYDYTDEFAMPVRGLAALGRPMILDGEMAVPDDDGRTHLDWLHEARTRKRPDRLAFFAFDLVYLDGFDLRRCPLEERIAILDDLIADAACPRVLSVGYVIGRGLDFFLRAREAGAEGIVSKRLGKPYTSGASAHWLKAKVNETRRFVVTGYETEIGKLHAIHVAEERDGDLIPQGRVKHGLRGLLPRLEAIRSRYPGYRDRAGMIPVKPSLFVDVKYYGRISRDGQKIPGGSIRDGVVVWFEPGDEAAARHGRFRLTVFSPKWWSCDTPGVIAAMAAEPERHAAGGSQSSSDRAAPVRSNIIVERANASSVTAESIQRVLDDAVVPRREALIDHWKAVGDLALDYLARRPLTLVRHVDGLTFFHEGALPFLAPGVHQMSYQKRRDGSTGHRVWIEDLAGLLGLVKMGVVELHPWGSAVEDINHPDTLVLDLDPDPKLDWQFVVETALKLRDIFEGQELPTWPKLTGGKGIHVVVPIEPTLTWEEGRAFIRSIAQRLAINAPRRYTLSSSLAERPGRIFLDYARNGLGATAVGCYSPRARPGSPVAMPVTWRDIERGIRPNNFTLSRVYQAIFRSIY